MTGTAAQDARNEAGEGGHGTGGNVAGPRATARPEPVAPPCCTCASAASLVLGAGLGVLLSAVVNSTLLEISSNRSFALYFGILFVLTGSFLVWRVCRQHPGMSSVRQKPLLTGFGMLVLLAGGFCITLHLVPVLELSHISPASRIPIFALIGTAVCFAVTCSVIDFLNVWWSLFGRTKLIDTAAPGQTALVGVVSSLQGFFYGVIFGFVDLRNRRFNQRTLEADFSDEIMFCYPLGAALGATAALMSSLLQHSQPKRRRGKRSHRSSAPDSLASSRFIKARQGQDQRDYDCDYNAIPTVDFDDYEDVMPPMLDEDDLGAGFA